MSFTLTFLGENSYLFNMDGLGLLINPCLSCLPDAGAELVFCTSDLPEHFDAKAVLALEQSVRMGPFISTEQYRALGIPKSHVLPLNPGNIMNMLGMNLRALSAPRSAGAGLLVSFGGMTVLVASEHPLAHPKAVREDITAQLFVALGGDMSAEELKDIARASGACVVVASEAESLLTGAAALLEDLGIRILTLERGCAYEVDELICPIS